MALPTAQEAIFRDLDTFLTRVDGVQDNLRAMRSGIELGRLWGPGAEIYRGGSKDPFKPRLQVVGSLTLSFIIPEGFTLEFSGKANPVEAKVHRSLGEALLVPTDITMYLDEDCPMHGRLVRAVLDEERLSFEAERVQRTGERKAHYPIRTEVVSDVTSGECLVAPLTMLTDSNRSSFYNLKVVATD